MLVTNHNILTTTFHTIAYTLIIPKITSPTTLLKELVFVSNPEKVITCLPILTGFKCPEHVISKSNFNAKLQDQAPNPDRSKNFILFVTTYFTNIDNKSLMQISYCL